MLAIESFLKLKDLPSYKIVYEQYYKSLCFFANEYLKNNLAVEDIVQDVLLQVWENPPKLQDSKKLPSYLYAMVRNRCLNHIRSLSNHQKFADDELTMDDWEVDESVNQIKAEVYREIMQSVEKLPTRAQEVFKLSYLTQLREVEIAERLNISVNSVKTHKKRAKEILKQELKHLFTLVSILNL